MKVDIPQKKGPQLQIFDVLVELWEEEVTTAIHAQNCLKMSMEDFEKRIST